MQFLAHVMVFGTPEDLRALRGVVGKDDYREVLEHAPPAFSTRDPGPIGTWFAAGSAPGIGPCRSRRFSWKQRIKAPRPLTRAQMGMTNQPTTGDLCTLNRVTEVAREFIVRR